jgi:hypothetical protein
LHRAKRHSLLLGPLGIGHALLQGKAYAQAAAPRGYVLGPTEGEQLILRGGSIFIKTDPSKGSNSLAIGTPQILVGVGIPIHRHFQMDEALSEKHLGFTSETST